ncbi:tRNA-splicing endonuclease subunit [Candidozyma auris]
MIFLPLIGNRVLIFEIDDIKKLREVGIVGVLSGTLPKAPQQNVFSGVPLQLSIYEVLWLIDNGHAKLIDSKAYHKMLMEGSTPQQINEGNKVRLAGPSNSHYVITPNTSPNKLDLDMNSFEVSRDEYLMRQPILHENFAKKYNAFSKLRIKCVKPDEEVNLIDLVTGGRLATAVKKAWVLVSEEPTRDDSIDAYSIEWAGFG